MKKLVLFESVHYTIKADKLLKGFGVEYQIVATPREISSDCGMCIEIDEKDCKSVGDYLSDQGIKIEVRDVV